MDIPAIALGALFIAAISLGGYLGWVRPLQLDRKQPRINFVIRSDTRKHKEHNEHLAALIRHELRRRAREDI